MLQLFFIDDETTKATFEVDLKSGQIRTLTQLDREERSEYKFSIMASNQAGLEMNQLDQLIGQAFDNDSITDVIISVIDKNDNGPQFRQIPYRAGIVNSIHS